MPRTPRDIFAPLTDADHGTLREIEAIDLDLCDPGTMIYVKTGRNPNIVVTTIIPGHPHGHQIFHGASVTGLPQRAHPRHPKSTLVSRHLRVGEIFKVNGPMGGETMKSYGRILELKVWSAVDYLPGS